MSRGSALPPDVIDSLRFEGPNCFSHIAPARHLPDIAASGGLLSSCARGEVSSRWGSNTHEGQRFVCLAFRPFWGIIKHLGREECVILAFDASSVAALEGVRLCPYNTASRAAAGYLSEPVPDPADTLRRCREHRGAAEVLVPHAVPLSSLSFLVFCDREARDAWWPTVRDTIGSANAQRVDVLVNGDLRGIRLPDDFVAEHRHRPVSAGTDKRVCGVVRDSPVATDLAKTVEELVDDWRDEDVDDEGDLFDQLYVSRDEFADFVDWQVGDDEPRYRGK